MRGKRGTDLESGVLENCSNTGLCLTFYLYGSAAVLGEFGSIRRKWRMRRKSKKRMRRKRRRMRRKRMIAKLRADRKKW